MLGWLAAKRGSSTTQATVHRRRCKNTADLESLSIYKYVKQKLWTPFYENTRTEFSYFHKITLTRNMRALSNEIEFVEFLKKLVMMKPHNSLSLVKASQQLIGHKNNIINEVYGNISENILSHNTRVVFFSTSDWS